MYGNYQQNADMGNEAARQWVGLFKSLGEKLSVRVE
jgi:hypothetical protein